MSFEPILISMSWLDPLYTAFGFIMRILYDAFHNYGIVIIIFTILLRAIMIPLGVKQYKGTIKQQGMSKELEEIKRKYSNNKEELQKAQQALYAKTGFSPLAGCLPSIIQLIIIWPVYRIISAPLIHIMGVSAGAIGSLVVDKAGIKTVTGLTKIVYDLGLMSDAAAKNAALLNIPIVNALNDNVEVLTKALNQGLIKIGQLIDFNFLGMNLGLNPSYKPAVLFGPEMSKYLPLLAIPILAVVTTWASLKVSQWTMPNRKQHLEEKERAKKNPAKDAQAAPDPTAGMTKSMTWFMPIFTLYITFTMPAAMGLYWVIGNIMSMVQQYILYFLIAKRAEVVKVESASK